MTILWLAVVFLIILSFVWGFKQVRQNRQAQRVHEQMMRNALSMLNIILVSARDPGTGVLARERHKDEYLIGYMAGIASACVMAATELASLRARKRGQSQYLRKFLDTYFPGDAPAIINSFKLQARDPASIYSSAQTRAETDMAGYWRALRDGISGNLDPDPASLCPGLVAHLGRKSMAIIPTVDGKIIFKAIFEKYQ